MWFVVVDVAVAVAVVVVAVVLVAVFIGEVAAVSHGCCCCHW